MPRGQLSDNDRARLSNHFWACVLHVCHKHDCLPGEVLNRLKKSHGVKGISPARAEIVRQMRITTFTYYDEGKCLLWLDPCSDGLAPPNAKPISLPWLGRALGFDHSTLVVAQQKLAEQRRLTDA